MSQYKINPAVIRYESQVENPENIYYVNLAHRPPSRIRVKTSMDQVMRVLLSSTDSRIALNRIHKELRVAMDMEELEALVALLLKNQLLVRKRQPQALTI